MIYCINTISFIFISLQTTVAASSSYQVLKTRAPAQFYHGKHFDVIICDWMTNVFRERLNTACFFFSPGLRWLTTSQRTSERGFPSLCSPPTHAGRIMEVYRFLSNTHIRNKVTGYFGGYQTPVYIMNHMATLLTVNINVFTSKTSRLGI